MTPFFSTKRKKKLFNVTRHYKIILYLIRLIQLLFSFLPKKNIFFIHQTRFETRTCTSKLFKALYQSRFKIRNRVSIRPSVYHHLSIINPRSHHILLLCCIRCCCRHPLHCFWIGDSDSDSDSSNSKN